MNLLNGFKMSFGAFAVLMLPAAALAATPKPIDPEALEQDRQVSELKNEVLELNSRLSAYEQALLFPAYSRVDIYVALRVKGFVLTDLNLSIDDQPPADHAYSELQSHAFAEGGWHHLLRANVAQGAHRIRAEFVGHYVNAKPEDPPLRGQIETHFEKGLTAMDVVLPIEGRGSDIAFRSTRTMRAPSTVVDDEDAARAWTLKPSQLDYRLGTLDDPRLASARFHAIEKRYFTALTTLKNIAAEAGTTQGFSPDYFWLLADSYLGFGLPEQAEAVYAELGSGGVDTERLAQARLRLAEFYYERGYLQDATAALSRLRPSLPATLDQDWRDLQSKVLLREGRFNEAVEVLKTENGGDNTPYMQYNLAVALVNDGRVDQGINVLDRLGRMKPKTVLELALRDRSNLSLGYQFLRNEMGGSARPVFLRVQVEGPFSNRALLGLGWAELAPRGSRQPRVAVGDEPEQTQNFNAFSSLGVLIRPGFFEKELFERSQLRPFARGKLGKDEEDALMRALVPWVELVKRDKMDPAVQEGMLAIPYALERLGAHEQALERYISAIKTLEEGRRRIDEAMRSIERLALVENTVRRDPDSEAGWDWQLRDLPDLPETYWLAPLLAQHRFQEALKNYRDTRFLLRRINAWTERMQTLDAAVRAVPPVPAEKLIAAQRGRNWAEQEQPGIQLRAADHLGAATTGAAGPADAETADAEDPGSVELSLAQAPEKFDGPGEKLAITVPAIDRLRPLVGELGARQARRLQRVGLEELEGQKQQLEKYLLEARFSMARTYDQRAKAISSGEEEGQ